MQKGQISLTSILSWGVVLVIAAVGSITASSRLADDKIGDVQTQVNQDRERIAKIEEAVLTIKEDNKTIKMDVKEILKALK